MDNMTKYIGFIIPKYLSKKVVVHRLASVYRCAIIMSPDDMTETCYSQSSCAGCIMNSSALIDYAVESKLITKSEALQITLDKS